MAIAMTYACAESAKWSREAFLSPRFGTISQPLFCLAVAEEHSSVGTSHIHRVSLGAHGVQLFKREKCLSNEEQKHG